MEREYRSRVVRAIDELFLTDTYSFSVPLVIGQSIRDKNLFSKCKFENPRDKEINFARVNSQRDGIINETVKANLNAAPSTRYRSTSRQCYRGSVIVANRIYPTSVPVVVAVVVAVAVVIAIEGSKSIRRTRENPVQ